MADINAYLREAINGPAPQHKVAGRNQFEISEGSNGALHTKIVDVDGNPLSTFPVEDKAVKAELAEIKVAQAEILDRLDGTFDTRLTGSNVEEVIAIKRDLYTDTKRVYLPAPEDVKGCFVHVIVSGITGTFTDSQGYSLWAFPYQNSPGAPLGLTREKYETGWANSTRRTDYASVYIHPDADPSLASDLHVFIPYRVNIGKMLRIDLRVEGEFDDGEGIDAEVLLRWLK